jgi:hypothetical protein
VGDFGLILDFCKLLPDGFSGVTGAPLGGGGTSPLIWLQICQARITILPPPQAACFLFNEL